MWGKKKHFFPCPKNRSRSRASELAHTARGLNGVIELLMRIFSPLVKIPPLAYASVSDRRPCERCLDLKHQRLTKKNGTESMIRTVTFKGLNTWDFLSSQIGNISRG